MPLSESVCACITTPSGAHAEAGDGGLAPAGAPPPAALVGGLGGGEGKREVTVAEELAAAALLEVEAVDARRQTVALGGHAIVDLHATVDDLDRIYRLILNS